MENQKVRDLSTAQNPKATDFVMLITNLTSNVLEKCQVSALRDLLTTNSISDDEDNALTTGSDNKLYVPDLTENIGIVASNLNDLSDDVNTVTNNLNTLTGQVEQIQTKVNNISNAISPNYSAAIGISFPYTVTANGYVYGHCYTGDSSVGFTVNNQYVLRHRSSQYGGIGTEIGGVFQVSTGDIVRCTGTSYGGLFFPMKGNGPNEGGGIGDLLG